MIYKCFKCGKVSFNNYCTNCGSEFSDDNIPIDPSYYSELNYKTGGAIYNWFHKDKQQRIDKLRDKVLQKYKKYRYPYLINFIKLTGKYGIKNNDPALDSRLDKLKKVLVKLGFDEIVEYSNLLIKLVRTTALRYDYDEFSERFKNYIKEDLESTLYNLIDETETNYKNLYQFILYYFWENDLFINRINFNNNDGSKKLINDREINKFLEKCNEIYDNILVKRFEKKLVNLDKVKDELITMNDIDFMSGFEFEEFLLEMFNKLGFKAKETPKTQDQGADLFLEKYGDKIVIQAKNYQGNIGNSAIQEAISARDFFECDKTMVISNSYFTSSAKELAEKTDVKLINRDHLKEYVDRYNNVLLESSDIE